MPTALQRNSFLTVLIGLIVLAWAALWIMEGTLAGHLLHGHLMPSRSWTQGLTHAGLFWLGWVLMSVAMMLPATLPLILLFRRMTRRRQRSAALAASLVAGYITAWAVLGLLLAALRPALAYGLDSWPWFSANPWAASAGLFLIAGAFQFSALKYRCLDECRSPLAFLTQHWGGRRDAWTALHLGWRHGLFCLGCCWALMLLMFAASTAHLLWMLILGILMASEKNLPSARPLGRPLGLALLTAALAITALHLS